MQSVDGMIADIIRREGGFVDDPADKGGATKHGVSLRYARGVGLDLDGDGDVDGEDIRLVTPEKAAELYRKDFFETPRFDRLPASIQPLMFDWAVNSGPPRPIMAMQKVLDEVGKLTGAWRCEIDGVIGPQTARLAHRADAEMGPFFLNALVEERRAFYQRVAQSDPSQQKFLKGWLARADEFKVKEGVA